MGICFMKKWRVKTSEKLKRIKLRFINFYDNGFQVTLSVKLNMYTYTDSYIIFFRIKNIVKINDMEPNKKEESLINATGSLLRVIFYVHLPLEK